MTELFSLFSSLPPKEERSPPGVFKHIVGSGFSSESDLHYLLLLLTKWLVYSSGVLLVALVSDAYLQTSVVIDPAEFDDNKLVIATAFARISFFICLPLAIFAYFRIRLTISIKEAVLPFRMQRKYLEKFTRGKWLWRCSWALVLAPLAIFFSDFCVIRLAAHYHLQDNLSAIVALQLIQVIGNSIWVYVVMYMLILEKVMRHYPVLKEQMNSIARD